MKVWCFYVQKLRSDVSANMHSCRQIKAVTLLTFSLFGSLQFPLMDTTTTPNTCILAVCWCTFLWLLFKQAWSIMSLFTLRWTGHLILVLMICAYVCESVVTVSCISSREQCKYLWIRSLKSLNLPHTQACTNMLISCIHNHTLRTKKKKAIAC